MVTRNTTPSKPTPFLRRSQKPYTPKNVSRRKRRRQHHSARHLTLPQEQNNGQPLEFHYALPSETTERSEEKKEKLEIYKTTSSKFTHKSLLYTHTPHYTGDEPKGNCSTTQAPQNLKRFSLRKKSKKYNRFFFFFLVQHQTFINQIVNTGLQHTSFQPDVQTTQSSIA